MTRSVASQALKVNGKKVGSDTLIVRYHEPPDQNAFRQPPASDARSSGSENSSNATSVGPSIGFAVIITVELMHVPLHFTER